MAWIARQVGLNGRTAILALFALAIATLVAAAGAVSTTAASVAVQGSRDDGYLLAADLTAEKLYVYRLPDLAPSGQLDDVKLGAHAGIVALPDGRVIFADDKSVEFVVMRIEPDGQPAVQTRVKIPTPSPFGRAAWGMVDSEYRYFALSSDDDGAARQTVTVLDLESYRIGQLQLELKKNRADAYEEVHPYLGGDPLTLYVTAGEEIRSFPVSDVMAGATAQPTATVPLSPNPHGPVISPELGRLYVTTGEGIDVLDIVGARLVGRRTIPWDVDGVKVGQNFRPRLAYDGGYVYGAVVAGSPTLAPEEWADSQVYVHAADLRAEAASLLPLAKGIVGRFQISEPYALFVDIHPDGDAALLVDVDPASRTFQQLVARVQLERLSNGPVAGQSPVGKETRSAAITPDGRWAFVSHGGDGRISVVDTAARRVARTVELPTPMKGGGYLAAVQPVARLVDLMAR